MLGVQLNIGHHVDAGEFASNRANTEGASLPANLSGPVPRL